MPRSMSAEQDRYRIHTILPGRNLSIVEFQTGPGVVIPGLKSRTFAEIPEQQGSMGEQGKPIVPPSYLVVLSHTPE